MKRPKTQNQSQLLQSIKIVNSILESEGRPNQTHVLLQNNWAIAHNGVLGIGEPIIEDLNICPNAKILEAALAKCGQSFSITQLEQKLSIKSDKFRALVPCMPPESLHRAAPDSPCALIDDRLKASFEEASVVPGDENSLLTASVLIANGSVIATDTKIVLESFHGISTPWLVVPKSFIKIAKKLQKKFIQFGFSNNSFTIFMEDGSWIKTQLWETKWPENIFDILNCKANLTKIPDDFWEGISAISEFSNDGWIHTQLNKLNSATDENSLISYDCYGIPSDLSLPINHINMIKGWAKSIDFFAKTASGNNCIKAHGEKTRCVIAGRQ